MEAGWTAESTERQILHHWIRAIYTSNPNPSVFQSTKLRGINTIKCQGAFPKRGSAISNGNFDARRYIHYHPSLAGIV